MKTLVPVFLAATLIALPVFTDAAGEADAAKGNAASSTAAVPAAAPARPVPARHARTMIGREKHSMGDGAITTLVKTKLLASSDTHGMDIHVLTRNGIVILTGKAKSKHEKMRAEQIARSVGGVRNVHNHLTIGA